MPDFKTYYDRYLLAAVGLLGAVAAILLVFASQSAKEAAVPPPAPTKMEPFSADASLGTLQADSAVMSERRAWTESTNGASPFVSRVYLLQDNRLVDILQAGSGDLFKGIPNSWILEYDLDYLDSALPERDPDEDGFTNFEEFSAQTNPRDAASRPEDWTKLRLLEFKRESLQLVLKTPVFAPGRNVGLSKTDRGCTVNISVEGKYSDPPDAADGKPRSNPPDFKNAIVEVRLGTEVVGDATVKQTSIDTKNQTFKFSAVLEVPRYDKNQAERREFLALDAYFKDALQKKDTADPTPFEVLVGAWINSQNSEASKSPKGRSAEYVVGQTLYTYEFVAGRVLNKADKAPFTLVGVSSNILQDERLGKGAKKEVFLAKLVSGPNKIPLELEQNKTEQSPYFIATLQDTRGEGKSFEVSSGKSFTVDDSVTYELIDIVNDKAVIKDPRTGNTHEVPMAPPVPAPPAAEPADEAAQ